MSDCLLGIDKGTTMTKAVVFDAATGRALGTARRPTPVIRPQPEWHEEDMDRTWAAVAEVIRDALAAAAVAPGAIAAIGVCGHMGGLWALDRQGAPLGNAIAWPDSRAASLLHGWEGDGRVRQLFALGGNAPIPGLPLVLLAYMARHQPDFFERAGHVLLAKDFLNYRLTGRIATDESDLSLFPGDIRRRVPSPEIFALAGVPQAERLLPPVLPIGAPVGQVSAEAAAATGLRQGTPVVSGAGDAVANAIGVGAIAPGQAVTVIGTSFMNNLTVAEPLLEPEGVGFLFMMPQGRWQRLMANTGGGSLCLDWVLEAFCAQERAAAQAAGVSVFEHLDPALRALPPLAGGLIFHPYLNTSGVTAPFHDPAARGSIFGLDRAVGASALVRAVMEGVALSMADCYGALSTPVQEIRMTGGGARSRLWCEICAAAMNRPLLLPDVEESGALGVALLAGTAVGLYPSLEQAAHQTIRIADTVRPDPALAARYAAAFPLFRDLRLALAPAWRRRADLLHSLSGTR